MKEAGYWRCAWKAYGDLNFLHLSGHEVVAISLRLSQASGRRITLQAQNKGASDCGVKPLEL